MPKITHTVHGCNFIRTGKCNQCGGCDSDCLQCPHGERREDGKVYCNIYETRGEVCEYCTKTEGGKWYDDGKEVTHQICVDFPYHPWLRVITSGQCSYKFTVVKEDETKLEALNDTWR